MRSPYTLLDAGGLSAPEFVFLQLAKGRLATARASTGESTPRQLNASAVCGAFLSGLSARSEFAALIGGQLPHADGDHGIAEAIEFRLGLALQWVRS